MKINASDMIQQRVNKKLGSLTNTYVFEILNQMSVANKQPIPTNFKRAFLTKIEQQKKQQIEPLYVIKMGMIFNQSFHQKARYYAEHYQVNLLKNLINQKLKIIFDTHFKQQYQAVLKKLAEETIVNQTK